MGKYWFYGYFMQSKYFEFLVRSIKNNQRNKSLGSRNCKRSYFYYTFSHLKRPFYRVKNIKIIIIYLKKVLLIFSHYKR